MIIKIKSHKRPSFKQLLNYLINDKDRLFDKKGRSFVLTHNIKGDSITAWVKQYQSNELKRYRKRNDSNYLTHEIISFHKEDAKNISLEKMELLAREYIKQRNPQGLYVAVPHFDCGHYHIHFCVSGISKTGRSLGTSKSGLHKLKKDIQHFQQLHFPELSKSIVNHGEKGDRNKKKLIAKGAAENEISLTDKEYQYKRRTGRQTEKENLIGILKTCYKKSNSKNDFFLLLKECGLETYERSGKITGIKKANIKFRFSRLGFTEQRIDDLNKFAEREKEINNKRNKSKIINRNR